MFLTAPVTISHSRNPGLEFLRSATSSVSISEERRLNATNHFVKLHRGIQREVMRGGNFLEMLRTPSSGCNKKKLSPVTPNPNPIEKLYPLR